MKLIDNERDISVNPEIMYINLDDDKRNYIVKHFLFDFVDYAKNYIKENGSDLPDDAPSDMDGYVGINALNVFHYMLQYAEEHDIEYELHVRIIEDEDTPREQAKLKKFINIVKDDSSFIFDPYNAISDMFENPDEYHVNIIDDNMYIPVKCTFAKTMIMNKR